jgi:DNA-binding Xre family transcriptional regulator
MPVEWKLKKWLAVERDIYRPYELKALLAEKAGVYLSSQAVSALMNSTPSALRIPTLQALCTALECKLSDFFEIFPETVSEQKRKKAVGGEPTRLYGNEKESRSAGSSEISSFPSPRDYMRKANKETGVDE